MMEQYRVKLFYSSGDGIVREVSYIITIKPTDPFTDVSDYAHDRFFEDYDLFKGLRGKVEIIDEEIVSL